MRFAFNHLLAPKLSREEFLVASRRLGVTDVEIRADFSDDVGVARSRSGAGLGWSSRSGLRDPRYEPKRRLSPRYKPPVATMCTSWSKTRSIIGSPAKFSSFPIEPDWRTADVTINEMLSMRRGYSSTRTIASGISRRPVPCSKPVTRSRSVLSRFRRQCTRLPIRLPPPNMDFVTGSLGGRSRSRHTDGGSSLLSWRFRAVSSSANLEDDVRDKYRWLSSASLLSVGASLGVSGGADGTCAVGNWYCSIRKPAHQHTASMGNKNCRTM
jgi:hypothetical protein